MDTDFQDFHRSLLSQEEKICANPVNLSLHLLFHTVYDSLTGNQNLRKSCKSVSLFRDGLCLPSGSNLTDADLERVTSLIRSLPTG